MVVGVNADAMIREAMSLEREGRVPESIHAYRQILSQWPALGNCWYNLGILQRKAGLFADALASYQRALDCGVGRPEEVHLNRGVILADQLRQDAAAERELKLALELNPAYIPALLNLANLQEDLGRREAATETYERILALEPRSLRALARYANLKRCATVDDPMIARLRCAIGEPDTSAADRADLGFALGRALDDCGSYQAAFAAYLAANRASRESAAPQTAHYVRALEERFFDRMIGAFPVARREPMPKTSPPAAIFVCGMFRSGSTLIEQLLAKHSQVTAGGELDLLAPIAQETLTPFPDRIATISPLRLQALAARYRDALATLFPDAELVTDKRPDNFLYIGLIKTLFPNAKIVHTTREPLDNCLSIFFLHLDQRMSYALDLLDIGHYYLQYRRLMSHWKTLYGGDIFDVAYDSFVQEPRQTAQRLLAFLGLDWQARCLEPPTVAAAVKTASVWQVREPLYHRSSGRARHYARELRDLRAYLEASL
ncbi:MAG TPA: sulfotransferase [Steroidobacteraceae bacterium]|nr:sulfotransferase [Steroidobacteraceae bacterium]